VAFCRIFTGLNELFSSQLLNCHLAHVQSVLLSQQLKSFSHFLAVLKYQHHVWHSVLA